jgi:hypothetical protein
MEILSEADGKRDDYDPLSSGKAQASAIDCISPP